MPFSVFSRCQCVYTHQRCSRTDRVQKIHNILGKNTKFNEHRLIYLTSLLKLIGDVKGRLDGAICEYTEEDKMDYLTLVADNGVVNMEMEALGKNRLTKILMTRKLFMQNSSTLIRVSTNMWNFKRSRICVQ